MQKLLLLFILLLPLTLAAADNPVDTILTRAERYLRKSVFGSDVEKLMATLNEKKQWPDIEYTDADPAGWEVTGHLQRLRSMALAWTDPKIYLYKSTSLKIAIDAALDHWLEMRYQNSNWWHNRIGVPRVMQDIVVLLRDDLSRDQFKQAMEVLGQHEVGGKGANLVWSADLGLHYGALAGDVAMIKKCSDLISSEIRITKGEGIQPDYSYHQHGARVQTYHYGGAFLRENVKLAWELKGTPWAFTQEKIDILVNFVLEGWQWMTRGIHTVPGTVDRSVSRDGVLDNADIRNSIPYLIELKEEKAASFGALAERQEGKGNHLKGFKYYPRSDFSAYQHPDFSFFVKTISVRTKFSENINGENLKGRLLNSGDTYFLRDGMEYFNLMPVWNWEYLPGITSFLGALTEQQHFTGGVSNGPSGLTVMHHKAEKENKSLSVKKVWASHRNLVVCLIGDLQVQNADTVFTVLDQCRWRGDVAVNAAGELAEGIHELKNIEWIHHAGFAYIPFSSGTLELHLKMATGTWSSINKSGSEQPVTEKIFMPVVRHANSLESTGYVVAACKTPEEAMALKAKPEWTIIRNDGECQGVLFSDGTFMASFNSSASVTLKTKKRVSVDRPCLVIVEEDKLFASDPSHTGGKVSIRIGARTYDVDLPADGTTFVAEL